jgi:hypothetical protein
MAEQPNVLFFHVYNLGFGELSCYSGGSFRGVTTERIDAFAWDGSLAVDPQEREPVNLPHVHSWTAAHFNRVIGEFHASVEREPLIPAGALLDHVPARTASDENS